MIANFDLTLADAQPVTCICQLVDATLPSLSTLRDKSLLRRNHTRRFDLHESIRQYSALRLESNEQKKGVTDRKRAEYHLTLLDLKPIEATPSRAHSKGLDKIVRDFAA